MKASILKCLTAITLIFLCGCIKTAYLEQETPAGRVAPPATALPPTLEQGLQAGYKAETASSAANKISVNENFRAAYVKAHQPRIAIYLNRALSDEVREWKADERIVFSDRIKGQNVFDGTVEKKGGVIDETTKKHRDKSIAASGEFSISHQNLLEESNRSPAGENWGWAFEDGFSKPFLEAGTKLIDRPTMMRLTAAEMLKNEDHQHQLSVRQVEMTALKGYADLLIEVLVTRNTSDKGEYDYKVAVKDVQTGQILTNTTTLNPDTEQMHSISYQATSSGFQAKKDDPYLTGRQLALEVIDDLTLVWAR